MVRQGSPERSRRAHHERLNLSRLKLVAQYWILRTGGFSNEPFSLKPIISRCTSSLGRCNAGVFQRHRVGSVATALPQHTHEGIVAEADHATVGQLGADELPPTVPSVPPNPTVALPLHQVAMCVV